MKRLGPTARGRRPGVARRAMTLIELIAVMALLAVVMTLSAPVLSRFFRGRALTEEARRMLALTRYARSEAISRSEPMEVWINPNQRTYGLRVQTGFGSEDEKKKPVEYDLQEGLSFELAGDILDDQGNARIVFLPDGSVTQESLEMVRIWNEVEREAIEVAKNDTGGAYVIQEYSEKTAKSRK